MKKVELLMGMPVTVEITQSTNKQISKSVKADIEEVFDYFREVDRKYSPFKIDSEVGKFNRGEKISAEMKKILKLAQKKQRMRLTGFLTYTKKTGRLTLQELLKAGL